MPSVSSLAPSASRLVRSARVARLATSGADRQPHVIPICFVFDGKDFFSPLDEKPKRVAPHKLKRLRNIGENAKVSLVIDHYEEDWRKLSYTLVFGKARVLTRGKKHRDAVSRLRRKYPQYRHMAIHQRPLIQITPNRWSFWESLKGTPSSG